MPVSVRALDLLFKAKTGVAWWDLPERYGPWKRVCDRFWHWSRSGTLTMPVSRVRVIAEAIDELDREVPVDSSIVCAHRRPPAGRATQGTQPRAGQTGTDDHVIGRSRDGTTTKIHLACDRRPLPVVLTGGDVHDRTMFEQVMAGICIPRHPRSEPGGPEDARSGRSADKGYASHSIRTYPRRHGITATIPERRDQQAGHPP